MMESRPSINEDKRASSARYIKIQPSFAIHALVIIVFNWTPEYRSRDKISCNLPPSLFLSLSLSGNNVEWKIFREFIIDNVSISF